MSTIEPATAGQNGAVAFATTHWSLVLTAQSESPAARDALEKLCRTYAIANSDAHGNANSKSYSYANRNYNAHSNADPFTDRDADPNCYIQTCSYAQTSANSAATSDWVINAPSPAKKPDSPKSERTIAASQ